MAPSSPRSLAPTPAMRSLDLVRREQEEMPTMASTVAWLVMHERKAQQREEIMPLFQSPKGATPIVLIGPAVVGLGDFGVLGHNDVPPCDPMRVAQESDRILAGMVQHVAKEHQVEAVTLVVQPRPADLSDGETRSSWHRHVAQSEVCRLEDLGEVHVQSTGIGANIKPRAPLQL